MFHLKTLFTTLVFAVLPLSAAAQFSDTFISVGSGWIVDRYAPAEFSSVIFDGDSRLRLTIDQTGATANRPAAFDSAFYNTQGRGHSIGITGLWTLSAQVYVSASFNTTSGNLARSDLWGFTGGDYMIFGFTNASVTNTLPTALNPDASDRVFRFRAFDGNTNSWIDLGVPSGFVFDAWHTITASSTGTTFEYRLDGVLLLSKATSAGTSLSSATIQGYNFGQPGGYSVYWDNINATAIPEASTSALIGGLAVLVLGVLLRRRR